MTKVETEPNDEDDEQIEFEIPGEQDGIKMIELKTSMKNYFIVLNDKNFHSFINKITKLNINLMVPTILIFSGKLIFSILNNIIHLLRILINLTNFNKIYNGFAILSNRFSI